MQSKKFPWYKRDPSAYIKKTMHLSLVEHGAYCLMLDVIYMTKQPLPAEFEGICRILRATTKPERAAVTAVLKQFFELGEGGYTNPRAAQEIKSLSDYQKAQAQNGSKGGRSTQDRPPIRLATG